MKNKRTIIVITEEKKEFTARAVKEMFAGLSEYAVIIIGTSELTGIAENFVTEKVLREDGKIVAAYRRVKGFIRNRKLDKIPKHKMSYKSNDIKHRKIANILSRYNPNLIVLDAPDVLSETVACRDKFAPDVPVYMIIDDYFLNKQLINNGIGAYFVENIAIKTVLVNEGIAEDRVKLIDLPVPNAFLEQNCEAFAERFDLDPNKKTVLFAAGCDGDGIEYALEEAEPCRQDYNFLVYAGNDRGLNARLTAKKYKVFNEGVYPGTLCAAADVIVARPLSHYLSAAFASKKPFLMLAPIGESEKRTADYIRGYITDVTESTALIKALSDGLNGEFYVKNPNPDNREKVDLFACLNDIKQNKI